MSHNLAHIGAVIAHMSSAALYFTFLAAIVALWLAWRVLRQAAWLLSRRNRQMLPWYRERAQEWQSRATRASSPAEARQFARVARSCRRDARWWQP